VRAGRLEMAPAGGAFAERALRTIAPCAGRRLELVDTAGHLLDGAHNPQAAEALAEYLRTLWARRGERPSSSPSGRMIGQDAEVLLPDPSGAATHSHTALTLAPPREELQGCADLGVPITVKPTVGKPGVPRGSPERTYICVTGFCWYREARPCSKDDRVRTPQWGLLSRRLVVP